MTNIRSSLDIPELGFPQGLFSGQKLGLGSPLYFGLDLPSFAKPYRTSLEQWLLRMHMSVRHKSKGSRGGAAEVASG